MSFLDELGEVCHVAGYMSPAGAAVAAGDLLGGMIGGKQAVNDEEVRQHELNGDAKEVGEKTGLGDMYEGAKEIPVLGEILKGPEMAEHFALGATKAGSWLGSLL